MWDIVMKFLNAGFSNIMNGLSEWIDMSFVGMLGIVLRFEEYFHEATWVSAISDIYNVLYWVCVGLLALRLLWKGFKVYGLWKDGDPENDPMLMLKDSAFALGAAAAFPVLYNVLADVAVWVLNLIIAQFPAFWEQERNGSFFTLLINGFSSIGTFVALIMLLLIGIMFAVIYFKLLVQGAIMLVLRLGVPFASIGLLDSDGGIWKTYIKMLFQEVITVSVQLALACLGTAAALSGTSSLYMWMVSLGCFCAVFSVPKQLNQLMLSNGGGGAGSKMMIVAQVVKAFAAAA